MQISEIDQTVWLRLVIMIKDYIGHQIQFFFFFFYLRHVIKNAYGNHDTWIMITFRPSLTDTTAGEYRLTQIPEPQWEFSSQQTQQIER